MSVHDGHRSRRKELFLKQGLDAFADHEALELLLFYTLPRVDTNPLAHRLLEQFGSLEGVFSATAAELEKVEGVGENAALLLSLIFPLTRRARTSDFAHPVILNTTQEVGDYLIQVFCGVRGESLYELCLDAKNKLLRCYKVASGGADAVNISLRAILEKALECNASKVILAHNHPSGVALPSEDDKATTVIVREALETIGVELVDHIIVADNDFVSMYESRMVAAND